jgi:hypothetical protein
MDCERSSQVYTGFFECKEGKDKEYKGPIKMLIFFFKYSFVRMRECDIWRDISEKEFENAKEGLEKLVMNRLYSA